MKKIMQLSMFMLAITGTTVFNSCKKDKKDDDSGKTKTELLTSGKWKLTGSTFQGVDVFSSYSACEKDNTYTFNVGGTGVYDEGNTKCDVDDDQSYAFDWSLTDSESKITFDGETQTLTQLTSSTLKVTLTEVDGGTTYTVVQTFSH